MGVHVRFNIETNKAYLQYFNSAISYKD
jgi:hypothetical protein